MPPDERRPNVLLRSLQRHHRGTATAILTAKRGRVSSREIDQQPFVCQSTLDLSPSSIAISAELSSCPKNSSHKSKSHQLMGGNVTGTRPETDNPPTSRASEARSRALPRRLDGVLFLFANAMLPRSHTPRPGGQRHTMANARAAEGHSLMRRSRGRCERQAGAIR